MAIAGLHTVASRFDQGETLNRLETAIEAKGMTIFARIDHAAGAAEVGQALRPTMLVIFGSAQAGTPLMQASETMAIDLPLKAVVSQDADGRTQVTYNDPHWLATRHGLPGSADPTVEKIAAALEAVVSAATK